MSEPDEPESTKLTVRPSVLRTSTSSTRFSLLVMNQAGVFTHALPESGEVTIGRGEACDVKLADAKASRVHVRLRIGDVVEIVDQGSMNGTRVGEAKLEPQEPRRLMLDDMITIGSTVLTLQRARTHRPPVRVYSEVVFQEHVAREKARAVTPGATGFAIVQLRFQDDGRDASRSTYAGSGLAREVVFAERLEATLADMLRPTDVVASYAPGGYEILLLETTPDVADAIASQVRSELRTRRFAALVGVACFPRDGATLEALSARADASVEDAPAASAEEPASQLDQGAMNRLAPTIGRIAAGQINVLILGETGVGKEVMARTLHERSTRAAGPLVCMNCAALSETLLESELFGYEKGAFTGANQAKTGLLESARGGTVFLDEIGEMPLSLQAKMLRVLEQREVQPVGSLRPRPIDVRFLAATNRDLPEEIAQGRFRQDLFFRLNGISITIPPLRERVEEIDGLAKAFVKQAADVARQRPPILTQPVLALLLRYPWPGNIRELRNVMERAVVLSSGGAITLDHLPSELKGPVVALSVTPPAMVPDAVETTMNLPDVSDELFSPEMTERERVVAALAACDGNQTHAARLLGVSRRTLVTRIEEFDLPRPRKK